MKKRIAMALVFFLCCGLVACGSPKDTAVSYSTHLDGDAFYNIATDSHVLPYFPILVSDEENVGDVHIRVLDGHGQIVGNRITVSPGETVILGKIPAFRGACTIQGKAVEASGEYVFEIS